MSAQRGAVGPACSSLRGLCWPPAMVHLCFFWGDADLSRPPHPTCLLGLGRRDEAQRPHTRKAVREAPSPLPHCRTAQLSGLQFSNMSPLFYCRDASF